ncbi:cellular protein metabolic process [Mactra antiquata]
MAGHSWALMPSVLIVEILSYLSLKDMLNASSVCKTWRSYLFQAKLWTRMTFFLRRNRRQKNKFLADVCGRFIRECAINFDPHDGDELRECFHLLHVLSENRNIQVLQLHPRSCHTEWTDFVTSDRFACKIESIIQSSRKFKHLSLGCSEELLAHCEKWMDILSRLHYNSLESLHLATVKEDSENYGIVDLDVNKFQAFTCLKHISIDYDHLNNRFLQIFSDSCSKPIETLNIHIHGVGPDHEKVTNASWRLFSSHNKNVEVTINLIHSYTGVSNLLDILKPSIPLTHFRQFFCSNINVAALGLMSSYYSQTLTSVHIVDGMEDGLPVMYEVTANEDPFVMMAWRCMKLTHFTFIGYHIAEEDVIAIARLRGKLLKQLHIPTTCISWTDFDGIEHMGNNGNEFDTMISDSVGYRWKPLRDHQLPDAVFDDWADAEQAYNEILLHDQRYKSALKVDNGTTQ